MQVLRTVPPLQRVQVRAGGSMKTFGTLGGPAPPDEEPAKARFVSPRRSKTGEWVTPERETPALESAQEEPDAETEPKD